MTPIWKLLTTFYSMTSFFEMFNTHCPPFYFKDMYPWPPFFFYFKVIVQKDNINIHV